MKIRCGLVLLLKLLVLEERRLGARGRGIIVFEAAASVSTLLQASIGRNHLVLLTRDTGLVACTALY